MNSAFPTLDKKVPVNRKYAGVTSSIDTGASAKKTQVVTAAQAARRRDEVFKRIRAATLVRLLGEREVVESVYAMGSIDEERENVSVSSVRASKAAGPPPTIANTNGGRTSATCASVPGSVVSVCDTDTTVDESRDLILLDLRDESQYQQCHLPQSVSYPAQKINRDQFTPDLHRCKRDPSKLLVVYHSNDSTTAGVATLLAQKGWDNVHALSGGFEEMMSSYPEVLEGEPPERPGTGASSVSVARSVASSRR